MVAAGLLIRDSVLVAPADGGCGQGCRLLDLCYDHPHPADPVSFHDQTISGMVADYGYSHRSFHQSTWLRILSDALFCVSADLYRHTKILQDFPHMAQGKSCKRSSLSYPDFPAIWACGTPQFGRERHYLRYPDFPTRPDRRTADSCTLPEGCSITRILPRFFTPFGAQSLETQGFTRCPTLRKRGESLPAILTSKTALEKWNPSGIAPNCLSERG